MARAVTDPRAQQHAEQSLEAQLDGLLADVASTVDEIGRKLGDDPIPAEPDEPTLSIGAEPEPIEASDVQQALETALADETPPETAQTETPTAQPTPPDPSHYGDPGCLDDELAALASHALDEDLGGHDPAETTPEPADAVTPESPANAAVETGADSPVETPEPAPAHAAHDPGPSTPHPIEPEPGDAAQTASPPAEPDPAPVPAPAEPTAPLRWGWLPPKPAWEPVYGRHRPLVAAWRHAAWITPPLLGLMGRWLFARARAAEPGVRHSVAVIASPLSMRDRTIRSSVGWLAVWTLFLAACLWIYVLVARSPATPPAPQPPTMLMGESAANAGS